jgi:hypothetical protein
LAGSSCRGEKGESENESGDEIPFGDVAPFVDKVYFIGEDEDGTEELRFEDI